MKARKKLNTQKQSPSRLLGREDRGADVFRPVVEGSDSVANGYSQHMMA